MLDDARSVTHAVNKTLNPEWHVTFDLPITGVHSLLLQCVCWDKDRFGKVRLSSLAEDSDADGGCRIILGNLMLRLRMFSSMGKWRKR